jgi:hypothetical protein
VTYPLAYTGTAGIGPSDTEFPAGPPLPQVTLFEIKQHLRIPAATTTHDGELTGYLETAKARIADMCVPLGPASVVDSFDGEVGVGTLVLSTFPVTAITSVTIYNPIGGAPTILSEAGGSTGLLDGYRKNLSAGTVRRIGYRTWPRGWGNIEVAYTAGPAVTPPAAWQAVKLTVETWWESRRISGNLRAPGGNSPDAGDQPDPTFGVPTDAYDLLLNLLKPPRIA